MKKAIVAFAKTRKTAETALALLYQGGLGPNEISVIFPKPEKHDLDAALADGALTGAAAGGTVGGAVGLLVGLGALVIPPIGPILALGPILIALTAAVAGAATGGIVGTLIGFGIPEIEAQTFVTHLRQGNILVAVHSEDPVHRTRSVAIFDQLDMIRDVSASPPAPTAPRKPGDATRET